LAQRRKHSKNPTTFPTPDVLIQEIEGLQAVLEQFGKIAADLGGEHVNPKEAYETARSMKIYAFDVDDTLEVSCGPISIVSVGSLKPEGHIVGLNGNWAVVVQSVPLWHRIFSFIGPMEMSKDIFLNQLKTYIPADDYIMVGNIKGVSGASDDEGAANLAGWRFIRESDFAAGVR
jgi:hypothetical protein